LQIKYKNLEEVNQFVNYSKDAEVYKKSYWNGKVEKC
tara:strand:- start:124 stop:234 length:111 start_codon:yes stop_codon:yes gene_type:complete